ncbi:porin family protein [uncultured Polaribacter sp.]|uniref:porin family protein n=1 Tax=uncultured Polaribacter sp. TaxID=174711 RepID=UPI00260CE219|nr:porin family protein [uncultured Polaribacter sp.]
MKYILTLFFLLFSLLTLNAQKESLEIGDRYAEDQLYISISYAQFFKQPSTISKSVFSFGVSTGFMKDFILNKKGDFAIALGVGYGYDFFNHELKVEEINNITSFSTSLDLSSNVYKSHNLEFPIELRWRTSNAKKYDFWRIYTGLKFFYNFYNQFEFTESSVDFSSKNVNSYNKFQYGLTLSAGYDEFNINVFYGLTPIFKDATLNGENINTSILKFGLIFYIL